MTNPTHKIGYKNEYFEVIAYHGQCPKRFLYLWVCKCKCSNLFIIPTDKLKYQKSCGKKHPRRHGLTERGKQFHPIYRLWCNIKKRCYSPEPREAKYYQGKGIKVCDEWLNDPLTFYNWAIENGWEKGLSLDRINPEKNYEPSNCEFVTRGENSRRAALKMWQTRVN